MNTKQRYPLFKEHQSYSDFQEQFPGIDEKSAHLVFKDERGKIRAGCYFGAISIPTFDLGIIPEDISVQSPEEIYKYASSLMQSLMQKERERRIESSNRINSLFQDYELSHHGVLIKGYVKKGVNNGTRDNRFVLVMTEPFQIQVEISVSPSCFAESVAGVRSFDDDGNLLQEEIRRQREVLIQLYKRELCKRNSPPRHPALKHLPTILDLDKE